MHTSILSLNLGYSGLHVCRCRLAFFFLRVDLLIKIIQCRFFMLFFTTEEQDVRPHASRSVIGRRYQLTEASKIDPAGLSLELPYRFE